MFNKKIISVLASLLVVVSCGGSDQEKASKFVEKGQQHLAQGNRSAAKIEFTNAVRLDKKSTQALFQLALLAESEQDWRTFEDKLNKLLQVAPQNIEARLKLSQFYVGSGQIDLAKSNADYLMKIAPENTDAALISAAVFYKLEQLDEARAIVDSIIEKSPDNVDAIFLKVTDLTSNGELEKSLKIVDKGLKSHPDNLALNMSKIQTLNRLDRWADTVPVLEHLISLHPENPAPVISLARGYANNGDLKKAISTLEAFAAEQENPALFVEAIKLIGATEGNTKAEARLKQFIANHPKLFDLRFALADLYVQSQRIELARQEYNIVLSLNPGDTAKQQSITRLARLDLLEGDGKSAWERLATLKQISAHSADTSAIEATLLTREGKAKEAIKLLREALRLNPESSELHVALGNAHEKDQQWELADQSYASALKYAQNKMAHSVHYARFLMSQGNFDKAERVISTAVNQRAASQDALTIYAQLMLQKKAWSQAINTADRLKTAFGEQAEYAFIKGVALEGQGNTVAAIDYLEQFYQQSSGSMNASQRLVQAYINANQRQKAKALIAELIKKGKNPFESHMLESRFYSHYQEWAKAIAAAKNALAAAPDKLPAYLHLAKLHSLNDNQKLAASVLEQGLERKPLNPTLGVTLAGIYQALEEPDKSIHIYQELLREHNDLDIAANNLAVLLLAKNNPEDLRKASKIAERFRQTKNPAFADTLGWVYVQQGNYDEGLALLRRAADKLAEVAEVQYHLGVAFARTGKKDLAKKALQKALTLSESDQTQTWMTDAEKELSKL